MDLIKVVKDSIESEHEKIDRLRFYKVVFISTVKNIKYNHKGRNFTKRCFVIVSDGSYFLKYLINVDDDLFVYNSSGYDKIGYEDVYSKDELEKHCLSAIRKYKKIIEDDDLPLSVLNIYNDFIDKHIEIKNFLKYY